MNTTSGGKKMEYLDFRDIIYEANIMGEDVAPAMNNAILDKINEIINWINSHDNS